MPVAKPSDAHAAQLLTSGELARRCDVTQRTIQFYEQRGLLTPARRRGEGYRYYDEAAIDRLHKIRQLQVIGLSLDEIEKVIDLYLDDDGGAAAKRAVLGILRGHLADADRQINELTKFRQEVFRSIVRLETLLAELERNLPEAGGAIEAAPPAQRRPRRARTAGTRSA